VKAMNLYQQSWELYREHSSSFIDDQNYYLELTRGRRTLEMFAGYGRIANFLTAKGVDIETVELSPDFSNCIELTKEKKHVANVVEFRLDRKFDRIIAGYNSFCLLTNPNDIHAFFQNVAAMLAEGGLASLSYYHPDAWTSDTSHDFNFRGEMVTYIPSCDLSKRKEKSGIWHDTYKFKDQEISFHYPVRIYESFPDMEPFLRGSGLCLDKVVLNYNNPDISESGWREYILKHL
jgi:SAM-dependent methyltransferase